MKPRICHRLLPRAALALPVALLVLTVAAAPASNEQDSVRAAVEAGRYKPLASILAQVEREWPGARVLDLDTKQDVQGQLYYEVKLLDRAGVKRKLLLDAATGRELAAGGKGQQALTPRELAAYLRRVEAESGRSVVEAELELGVEGRAAYQLVLAPSVESAQRRLMDAGSGQLLQLDAQDGAGALRTMPEALEALTDNYGEAAVLEVELEGVQGATVYYEIDLRVDEVHTLELQMDARTLCVLKSSYKRK